jgi:hypothetical protein
LVVVKVSIICQRRQTSFRCMYGLRCDEEAAAAASDSQSGLSKGRVAPGTVSVWPMSYYDVGASYKQFNIYNRSR